MGRLFIAEKYELAEVIANNLGNVRKGSGHFVCGQDRVAYCAGHMLELCEPEDYHQAYGRWRDEDLPIIMVPWKYKPIPNRRKQLGIIRELIKEADEIVHAGDVDAEGQLLVDEILGYYSVNKPVRRVLINDYNDKLVKKALANLKDNRAFRGLSQSALARSVADLHWGVNMSRLYSLAAERSGLRATLTVGRVQTPILGLVVNRDRAVESHQEAFHFTLEGCFALEDGTSLSARLVLPESIQVDEKGRLLSEEPLKPIQTHCQGQMAQVMSVTKETLHTPPPLPYDLLELQADASRKFGYSPSKTLKVTQVLREKHKLITYNRSDCRYLSDEKHAEAPEVLRAVGDNAHHLTGAAQKADASIKNRAFNSANVTAHHAIIPTEARADLAGLDEVEQNIYLLVARAYVAQFWPKKITDVVSVTLNCDGYLFKKSYSAVVSAGWSVLYKNDQDNEASADEPLVETAFLERLERLPKNTSVLCEQADIRKHKVPSPKYYTESTLLKDLRNVAKYVKNPRIANLLKAKDKGKKGESGGIGTPATRDSFIETLIKRQFIEKRRGKLVSTALGRSFYDVLPDIARQPDMTALWHEQQCDIEAGHLTVERFLDELANTITQHVQEVRETGLDSAVLKQAWEQTTHASKNTAEVTQHLCGSCGKSLVRRAASPKKGQSKARDKSARYWYGCSGYPECTQTYQEFNGKPDLNGAGGKAADAKGARQSVTVGETCPECREGTLTKRAIKTGPNQGKEFVGCTGFPKCKFFRWYG